MEFLDTHPWILAIGIFLARITDVSLGTFRTIMVIRSRPLLAALTGFFEVMIWILASQQVIGNLQAWYLAVAYAAGFACGNAVGVWLEAKLAIGYELVRTISQDRAIDLAQRLREMGYSVTALHGEGERSSQVEVLQIVERRRRTGRLLEQIRSLDPAAVCTISDAKRPSIPVLPPAIPLRRRSLVFSNRHGIVKRK